MIAPRPGARPARTLAVAAAVALAACAGSRAARGPAEAPAAERRAFAIPDDGALELAVPPGWTATEIDADAEAPTIRLEQGGARFVALVTPTFGPEDPGGETGRIDAVQLLAEAARRQALATSAEREIPLEEIVGDHGLHGFWFGATDRELVSREPGPNEWRHLIQGVAAVGPLVVVFTLLDDGAGPHRDAFLGAVRGARHVPAAGRSEPPPAAGRFELDEDASTDPLGVSLPGRTWTVLVDLPGFRVFEPRPSDGGVLVVGQDPQTGLVASVDLRPAEGAADAATCRERALTRIRAAAPELSGLRLHEAGPAARATYELEEVRGRPVRQRHSHAWLLRDGVCVAVHASKADPGAEDEARMERILASVRFGEDL